MIEITDFAVGLRQMAAHAEHLAERHDVAKVAELRRDLQQRNDQVDRDGDLIAELRKQVEGMGRSLDAIGRLRKRVMLSEAADGVQILVDALLVVGAGCTNYISRSCRDTSRTRTARFTAEAWCAACVARDALERAGLGEEQQR